MCRFNHNSFIMVSIIIVLAVAALPAYADCEFVWRSFSGGLGYTVYASTVYNGQLILGGEFTSTVGGDTVNYIARWDGAHGWRPLGIGTNGTVRALTVRNGMLIVGGDFTTAGGVTVNHIAIWNGSSWYAAGSGMNGSVYSLTVYNGYLIAGGSFTTANGVDAHYIASGLQSMLPPHNWTWQPLSGGMNNAVKAITVYNNQLIAGGLFTTAGGTSAIYLASWDGNNWHAMGSGISGDIGSGVFALTVYNDNGTGKLAAGGASFSIGHGNPGFITGWNGSTWQSLASGMDNSVYALTAYNGQLIAGGGFSAIGGVTAGRIARWDAANGWQPMGSGVYILPPNNPCVYALTVYNSQLIAGGYFTSAGGVGAYCLASWYGGSGWEALGSSTDDVVYALTVFYGGKLIAGGHFTTAGGTTVNHIASWDGSNWQPMGDGMNGDVYALTVYNGELIAGGDFTMSGSTTVNHIARWDGSSWQPLRNGVDDWVWALTVYNGQLIVGGGFTMVGEVNANHIALWDGNSWHPLRTGMNGVVNALTIYNDNGTNKLIAGGDFTTAGGIDANYISSWDGSNWHAIGSGIGVNTPAQTDFAIQPKACKLPARKKVFGVSSLTVYYGQLVAGGLFTTAGGATVNNIASWDGSNWQPLGRGLGACVDALTVYNGQLIAGGSDYASPYYSAADYIGIWNGNSWLTMSREECSFVDVLEVYNGQLITGGGFWFDTAGGKNASNIAAWPAVCLGDLNGDCVVDYTDLALFAAQWLKADCLYDGWCYGADFDYNTAVDFKDYAALANNWLTNVTWGDWAWTDGSDTVNQYGHYGTMGEPNSLNVPGARENSISWIDIWGNLWLFGGQGYASNGNGRLNDLWKFNPWSDLWTWVSGWQYWGEWGVYGTKEEPNSLNVPGARYGSVSWIDGGNNLWLFGGSGYDKNGSGNVLNDLWKFDGTNWTWVSGSDTVNQYGTYGTKGEPNSLNVPGARQGSVSWIDVSGNLWLFGGYGLAWTGSFNLLNDLWKFDGTNWTWVSGANTVNQHGFYGTKGVAASGNIPGAREYSISWIDVSGNLWLFGGAGYDENGNYGDLNDLWKFDGTNWTWVSGWNYCGQLGVYGAKGVAASGNVPGARGNCISWVDGGDNLWLFGGQGYASNGYGRLNDLWKFDGANWTWVSGWNYWGQWGIYNTEGVAASDNVPGARCGSVSWIDYYSGNLWLFGGNGYDKNGNGNTLNDLWKFSIGNQP